MAKIRLNSAPLTGVNPPLKPLKLAPQEHFDNLCDAYRKNTPTPSLVGLNLPKTATGA